MSIAALSSVGFDAPVPNTISIKQATPSDFMSAIGNGLERADRSLQAADTQLRAFAAGEDIPVHDVMIAMERARLELSLVVEVRNRLVEGVQELTRMQL